MMNSFERYCDDIEKVENYELAKADNFKGWHCHHRLELVATGGVCDVDKQDLIDWGIYWHRPADELIFLTTNKHIQLHMKGNQHGKGKYHSERTRRKISEALKGNQNVKDKHWKLSDETRKKMSEVNKGERNPMYGKHWKLIDGKRVYY